MTKTPLKTAQKKTALTTKAAIAERMNITVDTLRRRLAREGVIVPRGAIFPKQAAMIYEILGWVED